MHRTVVINVVGLTPAMLGPETPNLCRLAAGGGQRALQTVFPAVTCSVQSTFVTGALPREHGCVANGWYHRDTAEVALWKQSNHLVLGEKVWDTARRRDPAFTCAKTFWWFNMYSGADASVTPRPIYLADGLKLPDIYTHPSALRDHLVERLGPFPLFNFWGPNADIRASEWIAQAALYIHMHQRPTLQLIYLPHLDYNLQRLGPRHPAIRLELRRIDHVVGELLETLDRDGTRVIILSEYGITPVTGAVHINRVLRSAGLLRVRDELGREKLDAGASEAFAVADHQIAHVYVRRRERVAEVRALLQGVPGIERVLDDAGKRDEGIDHARSGELVAISQADRWFTYYYWLDDARAPEFARTVDIHRKPGYDPVELFMDPALRAPRLRAALRVLQKKLGFRMLMDVIPLDASLVRGSHGRLTEQPHDGPVLITNTPELLPNGAIHAVDVKELILLHLGIAQRMDRAA